MTEDINQAMRRMINATPILSEEEEAYLVEQWCVHKNIKARNKLVEAHGRLVASMARRFTNSGAEFSDLFNEGIVALTQAADRFDASRKNRFSTYAAWWILSVLQDAVHRDIYTVKIGRSRPEKKALRLLGTARQYLGATLEEETLQTISDISKCPMETVLRVNGAITSRSISLNSSISQEDGSGEMGDMMEDENVRDNGVEAHMMNQGQRKILDQVLSELNDPRAAKILRERYLLESERSLKEIGEDLEISSERVRQIEKDAIIELRELLHKKGFGIDILLK